MTSLEPKGLVSGLETPASEGPQLYATESTPGQLSRSDSFNELGMVSHKMLIITIFGQMHVKQKKMITQIDIFSLKNFYSI